MRGPWHTRTVAHAPPDPTHSAHVGRERYSSTVRPVPLQSTQVYPVACVKSTRRNQREDVTPGGTDQGAGSILASDPAKIRMRLMHHFGSSSGAQKSHKHGI